MDLEKDLIFARLFKGSIVSLDGQAFEDFFVDIMRYHNPKFVPVKPQGSLGDRKNDGFDPLTGTFYQVYAPETLRNRSAISKLITDFNVLMAYWPSVGYDVKHFYYVVNDKYRGLGPEVFKNVKALQTKYPNVTIETFTAADLERVFDTLPDNLKARIVEYVPNVDISQLGYDELNTIVGYIMENSNDDFLYNMPLSIDMNRKLEFNKLSYGIGVRLKNGIIYANIIDEFFDSSTSFDKEKLRNKLNGFYRQSLSKFDTADEFFWDIVRQSLPQKAKNFPSLNALFVLLAYYFQSCDIFEIPDDADA